MAGAPDEGMVGPRDPEEAAATGAPADGRLPDATALGAVHLTVADLTRSIAYYQDAIGLVLHGRAGPEARLGAGGEDLLLLVEEPGARPADGYCGLYHVAFLLPTRAELARWLAHAARSRVTLVGLADHFVSEALYLRDPDHHGIEIYWDRPRSVWEGKVAERLTTLPLDTKDLLGELDDPLEEPFERLAPGARVGHVHLRVAEVAATVRFYRDVLGFGLMAMLGRQAAFLAAGGYHHHVGANTWESAGAPPAPAGSAALRHATVLLPDAGVRDALAARVRAAGQEPEPQDGGLLVRDPSGNALLLGVRASG